MNLPKRKRHGDPGEKRSFNVKPGKKVSLQFVGKGQQISEFLDALLHERSAEQGEDWPFADLGDAELDPRDAVNEAETIILSQAGEGVAREVAAWHSRLWREKEWK